MDSVLYLPQAGSTNLYAKQHLDQFGPVGAVYTTHQTEGRGRLGRAWADAPGQALFYTVVIKEPMVQPHTLPLLASLSVAEQLRRRYGVQCQIKWPNDLLLNGKKLCGILCEGVPGAVVCGIGINLAQSAEHFAACGLSHATSLALEGVAVDLAADPEWLAQQLTAFGFDRPLYTFAAEGFAPYRDAYRAACVNLGRRVWFDGGSGTAHDVDEEGRLVVRTNAGDTAVFTGEVSVRGIYGQV